MLRFIPYLDIIYFNIADMDINEMNKMNATSIRELRDSMGLSQSKFAKLYHIPLSTLQKWEQGGSKPPEYVIELLSMQIPYNDKRLVRVVDGESIFFYDPNSSTVCDRFGNRIRVNADVSKVKKKNLPVYLRDLFEAYYDIVKRFERDCEYDAKEDIIWS